MSVVLRIVGLLCLAVSTCCARCQTVPCNHQPPASGSTVMAGVAVYYKFDPSFGSKVVPGISAPIAMDQVKQAFSAWSSAAPAGTTFVLGDEHHTASVIVFGSSAASTDVAQTYSPLSGLITPRTPATITFFPQANLPGGAVSAYQATAPGYTSAYFEAALHEIGHVFGIGDYAAGTAPAPGTDTSVITPFIGVNDVGNTYQKSGPTPCDIAQAAAIAQSVTQGSSGGGGGGEKGGHTVPVDSPPDNGGGGSGTGGLTCESSSYYDVDHGRIYVWTSCS